MNRHRFVLYAFCIVAVDAAAIAAHTHTSTRFATVANAAKQNNNDGDDDAVSGRWVGGCVLFFDFVILI